MAASASGKGPSHEVAYQPIKDLQSEDLVHIKAKLIGISHATIMKTARFATALLVDQSNLEVTLKLWNVHASEERLLDLAKGQGCDFEFRFLEVRYDHSCQPISLLGITWGPCGLGRFAMHSFLE